MNPRVRAAMAGQHGLITTAQALRAGLDRRGVADLMREGELRRVRSGVHCSGEVWDSAGEFVGRPLLRVRAAALVLESDYRFSHDSAAVLHGIWLPDARASIVHVNRVRFHGRRTKAGIKHHRAGWLPDEATTTGGLPVLDPARTALDIVREHGLTAGVAAIDCVRRQGVTLDRLYEVAARMRGWPRSRAVHAAVEFSDPRSESWLESAGRMLVLELGLGEPDLQFEIALDGRYAACDLRIRRHIIEIDGLAKLIPVADGGLSTSTPAAEIAKVRDRTNLLTGLRLGLSNLTWHDIGPGRAQALVRLRREIEATDERFGTSLDDLAPFIVHRRYPPAA